MKLTLFTLLQLEFLCSPLVVYKTLTLIVLYSFSTIDWMFSLLYGRGHYVIF